MTDEIAPFPWTRPIVVARLKPRSENPVRFEPDNDQRTAMMQELELLDLRKVRIEVKVTPFAKRGWQLLGRFGATVTQTCVVTAVPVTTRIDEAVTRQYLPEKTDYEAGSETELGTDDVPEPLTDVIDVGALLLEELSLALPDYPRAEGAEPANIAVTEPGKDAMSDEDARPFAALKGLRDTLAKDTD